MEGLAHWSSRSSRKYGWPSGPRHSIWDQLWIPYSHNGASFSSRRVACGKGCVSQGQPSSSRLIGILAAMEVDIWFPDHISVSPRRCKSAVINVAAFLPITEGQVAWPLWVWKASSSGQFFYLTDACCREALAVVPSAPSSFRI